MILKKSIVQIIVCLALILQSCKGDVKLDNLINDEPQKSTAIGTKHFLEEDGIQLQLPDGFERFSIAEYSEIINQKKNAKNFVIESAELKKARSLNGNGYVFFNPKNKSTYLINAIPYSEIKEDDAQKILGIIRQNHKEINQKDKVDFKKVTAKFKAIPGFQVFKAVFKANLKSEKLTKYQHSYFINSTGKSVLIKLITPEEIDFDKYIEKMMF